MMKILALVTALAAGAFAVQEAQDMMQPASSTEHHAWLQQLVGEWTCKAECSMGPDAPPMTLESTEKVRAIGKLWIVADGAAEMDGTAVTTMMTLGYNEREKAFIGSWVDSMQTHMWNYVGQLDAAKKVLTLEAEGPNFMDPSTTCKFRDAIEIRDADHKVMTSSMEGPDGTWTTFMRAEYTRKK